MAKIWRLFVRLWLNHITALLSILSIRSHRSRRLVQLLVADQRIKQEWMEMQYSSTLKLSSNGVAQCHGIQKRNFFYKSFNTRIICRQLFHNFREYSRRTTNFFSFSIFWFYRSRRPINKREKSTMEPIVLCIAAGRANVHRLLQWRIIGEFIWKRCIYPSNRY